MELNNGVASRWVSWDRVPRGWLKRALVIIGLLSIVSFSVLSMVQLSLPAFMGVVSHTPKSTEGSRDQLFIGQSRSEEPLDSDRVPRDMSLADAEVLVTVPEPPKGQSKSADIIDSHRVHRGVPPADAQLSVMAPGICTENVALVLIAHDREEYLRECLASLSRARNLSQVCIIVSMDEPSHYGSIRSVFSEFPQIPATFIEQSASLRKFSHTDFAITWHHGQIFEAIFDERAFEFGILLETDLTVSPDFIEYMLQARHVLANDRGESLFCVSAWNDNGFNECSLKEDKLYRTDFFPGLGWMLHRDIWVNQLSSRWPREASYDWWIRTMSPVKNLDCIAPQVSRTHHISKYGSHVNGNDHKIYDRMLLSSGSIALPDSEWAKVATRAAFEQTIKNSVLNYTVLRGNVTDIKSALSAPPNESLFLILKPSDIRPVLKHLKLYSDTLRGGYQGLLSVQQLGGRRIIIVDDEKYSFIWMKRLGV
jgi:hypothetical protein